MQGTYTEKIIRTRPSNDKVLERKLYGKEKSFQTRKRQKETNKHDKQWEMLCEIYGE